jgi:hypothetical protein
MNRALPIGLSGAVCLAALWAAIQQGRQLSELRAEQRRWVAELDRPQPSGMAAPPEGRGIGGPPAGPASPELLRLRSEVTRLGALQRELTPARAENERLRVQLAAAGTNNAGRALPPGYVRRAEAVMAGYNRPENTLQSLLWAVHHKDRDRVLQAFTPAAAEQLQKAGAEDLLQSVQGLIGMGVVGKELLPDGSVEVRALVAPDLPALSLRLESIGGQWKIAWPPR